MQTKSKLEVDYQLIDEINGPPHYHNTTIPEHRLLWAILSRAVEDSIGNTGTNINNYEAPRFIQDAYCWIMYPKWLKDYQEFSFENICAELEINPLVIRKFVAIQCKKPRELRSYKVRRINHLKNENKKGAGRPKLNAAKI